MLFPAGSALGNDASPVRCLYLRSDVQRNGEKILEQELWRQALLMAARHEFGLWTRDEAILETPDDADSDLVLELDLRFSRPVPKEVIVELFEGKAPDVPRPNQTSPPGTPEPVYRTEFSRRERDLAAQVDFAERFAREQAVQLLTAQGLVSIESTEKPGEAAAEPDANLSKLQFSWNSFHQYALVRELHGLIKEHGADPQLFGRLGRSYAILGMLAEGYLGIHSDPLYARALIYAQRGVRLSGSSAASLADRAFVYALVGLPAQALEDIEAAESASDSLPAWVRSVKQYCLGNRRDLIEHSYSDQDAKSVGAALAVRDASMVLHRNEILNTIAFLKAHQPSSTVPHYQLYTQYGLGTQSRGVREASGNVAEWLYKPLGTVAGLPEDCKPLPLEQIAIEPEFNFPLAEVNENRTPEEDERKRLIDQLIRYQDAKLDNQEPSLGFLGRILSDESMRLSLETIILQRNVYGVNCDDEIERLLKYESAHRLHESLNLFRYDYDEGRKSATKVYNALQNGMIQPSQYQITQQFITGRTNVRQYNSRHHAAVNWSLDDTLPDQLSNLRVRTWDLRNQIRITTTISKLAPHSSVSASLMIQYAIPGVADKLDEYEADFSDDPAVLKQLGDYHCDFARLEEATRCWEKSISISPNYEILDKHAPLAGLLAWDEAATREAFQRGLAWPNSGLTHSSINAIIASTLLREGNYEAAIPYARKAADSYSYNGLYVLSRAYEQAGDISEARDYMEKIRDRYDRKDDYFCWSIRYGGPEFEQAWQQYRPTVEADAQKNDYGSVTGAAMRYYANDELDKAAELFEKRFEFPNSEDGGFRIYLACIYDRLGDTERRDFHIEQCLNTYIPDHMLFRAQARLMKELIADPYDVDREAIMDRLFNLAMNNGSASVGAFAIGTILKNRGNKDDAAYFFEIASSAPGFDIRCRLAGARLNEMGIELPPIVGNENGSLQYLSRTGFAEARRRFQAGKIRQATEWLDILLDKNPDHWHARYMRMKCRQRIEPRDHALEDIAYLEKQTPNEPILLLHRGDSLLVAGKYQDALDAYERCLNDHPESLIVPYVHARLAALHSATPDEAVTDAEKAVFHAEKVKLPETLSYYQHQVRAEAFARAGRYDDAIKELDLAHSRWLDINIKKKYAAFRKSVEAGEPIVENRANLTWHCIAIPFYPAY
ncbi:tetratricopeptide repeat protein [Stratiformator vulcanicus]|nr:tetratricopeptide repeat protein [Stratiformator vulcanicus]